MKKISIIFLVILAAVLGAKAQDTTTNLLYSNSNATLSPYSQYGWGDLHNQANGMSVGMNGVGQGLRLHNQANFLNPASYSAVDSMSFIFDAGISGTLTNYKENGNSKNTTMGSVDYIVALFRVVKNLGVSLGTMPYSHQGYLYYAESKALNSRTGKVESDITNNHQFKGVGAMRQTFLGIGWQPVKNFSIGVNASYLWGGFDKYAYTDVDNTVAVNIRTYTAHVNSYKLDFGAQYTQKLSNEDFLTLGVTYSNGHKVCNDASCTDDTLRVYSLSIPTTVKAGAMLVSGDRLRIGADYELHRYSKLQFPSFNDVTGKYEMQADQFKDLHRINIGADWCPKPGSRSYFNRVHYRGGVGYSTPYVKINGHDGPREISASIGFGLPIQNAYNARSIVNVSAQWVNTHAAGMVTANSFRINIGICFNERWFAKWKAE